MLDNVSLAARVRRLCADRPIAAFLALAVGPPTVFLLVARLGPTWLVDTRIPITLAKYGPSMAGLIVVWCSGGRAGIRRLLGTLDPRRVSPTWYAVCVLVPTVVYGFALVGAYRGLPPIVALDWGGFLGSFGVLFLVRMFLGGGLGEELGWRGMMLPELARRHEVLTATLLIGVAHGLWHFPASGIGNALVVECKYVVH